MGVARKTIACSFAAAMACALGAHAQEGPIVIGQRERPRGFHIERPRGMLTLLGRYSENSFDSSETSNKTKQTYLRETLGLDTRGHLFSPDFMRFDLAGSFGLTQSEVNTNGVTEKEDGTIYEFNLSAEALGATNHPIRAYATRTVDLVDRSFSASLESTNDLYGIDFVWNTKNVNNLFRLYRTEQHQTALTGQEDFSYTQDVFEWQTNARLGEYQRLDWFYSYTTADLGAGTSAADTGSNAYDTQTARLAHSVNFGPGHRHSLRSSLNYSLQQGQTDYELLRIDELLNFRHTDRFDTFYNYSYSQSDYTVREVTQHRGRAGFRHRLYDSLLTTGSIGASQLDVQDAATTEYFGDLSTDYTKRVPLGILGANVRGSYIDQENEQRTEAVTVVDQPLALVGFQPTSINQRNVVPGSIRLTDNNNLRVYREGIDYTIQSFPDRVEIRRLPGGAIPSSSTVLADYDLAPEGASTIKTTTLSFGGRYSIQEGPLRGLTPYIQYTIESQDVSSDDDNIPAEDVNDLLYGFQYDIWRLTILAEQEIYDSTVSPYDATRVGVRYSDVWFGDMSVSAGAFYTTMDYQDRGTTDILTLDASVEYQLTRELYITGIVRFLDEKSPDLNSTGNEQEINLRWDRRQTSIYGLVRHTTLDTDEQSSDFLLFQIGVQRRF